LVGKLRDILHAEKPASEALPEMEKPARSAQLEALFQTHFQETEQEVERLNESLKIWLLPPAPRPA
jgi:ferritin-like metal-binding protein YciE